MKSGFAAAIAIAAGAFLCIASVLAILQGISAIATDKIFIAGPEYLYSLDVTGWGWIHLILGIVGVIIAIGMIMRAGWALIAAIIIASLSIIAQFLWLPYYPWWAILVIFLDIMVIWAAVIARSGD
ncbi:DUF7144 family membrane protein [Gordonia iterans]